jgi:RHS repeat-associated protein
VFRQQRMAKFVICTSRKTRAPTSQNLRPAFDTIPRVLLTENSVSGQRIFIGQEYDSASQLSYLNARYYDGGKGKFLSQDPCLELKPRYLVAGISVLSKLRQAFPFDNLRSPRACILEADSVQEQESARPPAGHFHISLSPQPDWPLDGHVYEDSLLPSRSDGDIWRTVP